MAVGYRSSSSTGNVVQATSRAPTVPTGADNLDVVVVFLHRWETFPGGTVTGAAGFTKKSTHPSNDGLSNIEIWWKRLSGADGGTYSFTWADTMWCGAHAICLTGAVTTGDPLSTANAWAGTAGTFGSTSVTTAYEPGLLWHAYNDSSGTHTPPGSYTELFDNDSYTSAYRIPATTGTHTASGGSVSSSSSSAAVLIAVQPEGGAAATSLAIPRRPRYGALIQL